MKLVNCKDMELQQNAQGLFFFVVGSTKIFVHKSLVKKKCYKKGKGIKSIFTIECKYFLRDDLEVDLKQTKKENLVLIPVEDGCSTNDYEYLIYVEAPIGATVEAINTHRIITKSENSNDLQLLFNTQTLLIAGYKYTRIKVRYTSFALGNMDFNLSIVNGKLYI